MNPQEPPPSHPSPPALPSPELPADPTESNLSPSHEDLPSQDMTEAVDYSEDPSQHDHAVEESQADPSTANLVQEHYDDANYAYDEQRQPYEYDQIPDHTAYPIETYVYQTQIIHSDNPQDLNAADNDPTHHSSLSAAAKRRSTYHTLPHMPSRPQLPGGQPSRPTTQYSPSGFDQVSGSKEKQPDKNDSITFKIKFQNWFVNEGPKYLVLTIWIIGQIVLFLTTFFYYASADTYRSVFNIVGYGLPTARGAAACLSLNCMLILFPVCRNIISILRNTFLNRIIPFDKNITFHILIGWSILFWTHVHIFAHYNNYQNVSTAASTNQVLLQNYPYLNSALSIFFSTGTGWTGFIAYMCMFFMFSSAVEAVRRKNFEFFWYTHHLFIIFYLMLGIHGMFSFIYGLAVATRSLLVPAATPLDPNASPGPGFYKWVVGTLALYIGERLWREIRARLRTYVSKVVLHPSKVVEIQIKKPSFKMRAGQYIFLHCPDVSPFQWHPFTLTSAPEEDYLSVHVRVVGDFTTALAKRLGCQLSDSDPPVDRSTFTLPKIYVDGPFGSASEDVFNYEVVALFGAGIGVTPFASILKSIWYRVVNPTSILKLRKVYFFWISRDKSAFEWFHDLLAALEAEDIDQFLEIHSYLTGGLKLDEIRNVMLNDQAGKDGLTGLRAPTHYGRPNFDAIFKQIRDNHAGSDVGVFFCGPKPVSNQLHRCSNKYTDTRPGGTKFFYNKENF